MVQTHAAASRKTIPQDLSNFKVSRRTGVLKLIKKTHLKNSLKNKYTEE